MCNVKLSLSSMVLLFIMSISCSNNNKDKSIVEQFNIVEEQIDGLRTNALEQARIPRATTSENTIKWTRERFDWTEGFFPGTCWYLYEQTNDVKWKEAAIELQNQFIDHRFLTYNHDLGFVFNCSFGHAYKITNDPSYRQVLTDAGNSLITRFNPAVGCIQSWNVDGGWQSKRGWQFPVIIDNMMNLELLYNISNWTNDPKYREIADLHAMTTIKNHFREDFSTYHVIDYDSISGEVRNKQTAQGYSHESSWARGQAWGLYGYTMCYRFTKNPIYLKTAEKIAGYILTNKALPTDMIPYWDFNVPIKSNTHRDASAAAIIASALVELDTYSEHDYLKPAKQIITNLSSKDYFSSPGENNHFILKKSVGSIPHNEEINVSLSYADYYYIEALSRVLNSNNTDKLALNNSNE